MRPSRFFAVSLALAALAGALAAAEPAGPFFVLPPDQLGPHVQRFNAMEPETVVNVVPNAASAAWLERNIPLFSCPDPQVEEIYYFRWWSFRKHLIRTPTGFAFTEFLLKPDPISSAVGHHVLEGRWLRDPQFVDDYIRYWLRGGPNGGINPKLHGYSEWLADAVYRHYLVRFDRAFALGVLDDLVRDYELWEKERQLPDGLYWQFDVRDAMEESISGSRYLKNIRPPLNSYQYGNARAIAALARLAGRAALATTYDAKADRLRSLVEQSLWNPAADFFEVRRQFPAAISANLDRAFARYAKASKQAAARKASPPPAPALPEVPPYTTLSDVREEIGFIPWYFELPEPGHGYESAWAQFRDPAGFDAPWGLTTAERRCPAFRSHGVGTCEWDGAVWPFATSQTLTALGNVLRDYPQQVVTPADWFHAFLTYTRSQYQGGRPYVGEYLDEKTGRWIKVKDGERSRYYNHSTYADLVIADLVGLRPRADNVVEITPLLPANSWDWFCLDGVPYHGHALAVVWDRTGEYFHRGSGLTVLADGRPIAHSATLTGIKGELPPAGEYRKGSE